MTDISENLKLKTYGLPLRTANEATRIALGKNTTLSCAYSDTLKFLTGFVDENLSDAVDVCKVLKKTEEEFTRNVLKVRYSEKKEDYATLERRLGTYSDKPGHIYGLNTWGVNVDEPGTYFEYPVGIDVVILSIFNTQPVINSIDEDDDELTNNNDFVPKPFLTSKPNSNFEKNITEDSIWTIRRVKNLRTFDFDYLRDLNKVAANDQSMDGMVYCIWNKKTTIFKK